VIGSDWKRELWQGKGRVCGMRKENVLSERVLVRGDNRERGENVL